VQSSSDLHDEFLQDEELVAHSNLGDVRLRQVQSTPDLHDECLNDEELVAPPNLGDVRLRQVQTNSSGESSSEEEYCRTSRNLAHLKVRPCAPDDVRRDVAGDTSNIHSELRAPSSLGELKVPSRVSVAALGESSKPNYDGCGNRRTSVRSTGLQEESAMPISPIRYSLVASQENDVPPALGYRRTAQDLQPNTSKDVTLRSGQVRPTLVGARDETIPYILGQPDDTQGSMPAGRHRAASQCKQSSDQLLPATASQALVDGATVMLWKGRRSSLSGRSFSTGVTQQHPAQSRFFDSYHY
jgi:hypothetical protein